ncbi:lipopolysaccharide transport periplasmic protein LptA [Persephonella sp.]
MQKKIIVFTLLILINFTFLKGEESEQKEPILIEADELVYNKKDNVAVYKGGVTVRKGELTIKADKMTIYLIKEGDISKIIAEGNVSFKKGNRSGSSERAEYYKDKNIIILIDKARITQDQNIIEGDEIIYHLDTEMAEVKGKDKKVRTVIFPENLNNKEKE